MFDEVEGREERERKEGEEDVGNIAKDENI